ncbi:MAG: dUTP diphosphatase [Alphaproteobacteria bacterium]|nr:dUTP diphosphatase [Alphaproteobacteria bacterium]OJV17260.1 MAG: deoxyuridine 5'-triphosphate nucleotidohydrolase [Alphaproteobacteria bacterium 33-17]
MTEILEKVDAIDLKVTALPHHEGLEMPFYATVSSAGMDLLAAVSEDIVIEAGKIALIPTGICIELPEGYEAQVRPRSGLAFKEMVTVLNSPGTIDADYRGEIKVILINHNNKDFVVSRGMRIAQMVVAKYVRADIKLVDSLSDSDRGAKGFGSTGVK